MKSAEILSNTDRTSWSRIFMTGRYFMPRLRWILWAYPLAAVIITFASVFLSELRPGATGSNFMNLLAYMIALAPLALARRADGELTFSLPALGWEKCTFLFGFFLLAVPLLVMVPAEITARLMDGDSALMLTGNVAVARLTGVSTFIALSFCMLAAQLVVCLWTVMGARRNRILLAVVFTALVSVANALAIGVVGAVVGFREAMAGKEMMTDMTDITVEVITAYSRWALPVMIMFLLFAWLRCARTIARRQL